MKTNRIRFQRLTFPFFLSAIGLIVWFGSLTGRVETAVLPPESSPPPHIGYGFNVAPWDYDLILNMGFDWMKVFDAPGARLPVNILIRVDAHAQNMGNLPAYGQQLELLAQGNGAYIEAYEIGNEPNLDASYGWNAPPIAADYAQLLCVAYDAIKQHDPTAIVVSAGLAPVGRVQGTWQGHAGHNGLYQDEREYLLEFIAAGGADCFDALGYHPYGFSADFDAAPDVASSDPTQNCVNGFCFRGVEKIHELMVANGLANRSIWATEFGWIVNPPEDCLNDPSWQGRAWQIVSVQKQASNLVGAYTYADANYPWMGGMFVFNLNFNEPGWYDVCEQMRYYAVEGRPAQPALTNMPKNPVSDSAILTVWPDTLRYLVDVDEMPLTTTLSFQIGNEGGQSMPYTVSVSAANGLGLTIPEPVGQVGPLDQVSIHLTVEISQPLGVYTAVLLIQTNNDSATLPVEIEVLPEVYRNALPAVLK